MGFKLLAFLYFGVIAIVIASLTIEFLGPATDLQVPIVSEIGTLGMVTEALPFLLCFLGIVLVFYALKQYPIHHPTGQTASPNTSTQAQISKQTLGIDLPQSNAPGINLPEIDIESETTLLIEDIDFENTEQESSASEISVTGYTNPPDLDPITEARVYISCGRNFQAIELLMDALNNQDAEYEDLTLEIIETMEREISHSKTTRERKDFLFNQRDDFLQRVSKERMKMSSEAWRKIHLKYPVQTDSSLYKMAAITNARPVTRATASA